jgi:hypothetical protein
MQANTQKLEFSCFYAIFTGIYCKLHVRHSFHHIGLHSGSIMKLRPMSMLSHCVAYISLFLLVSWYHIMCFSIPILVIGSLYYKSLCAQVTFLILAILVFLPLEYNQKPALMNSWIFRLWRDYFSFTYDSSGTPVLKDDVKYMFLEFPHGIFPMGTVLSASVIHDIYPKNGHRLRALAANAVFNFPVMRQFLSSCGTCPASRKQISDIYKDGNHCVILPGGIAEIYLVNREKEAIYLRQRQNTIKAAIEEGAQIVPVWFFGTSLILDTMMGSKLSSDGTGLNSWVSKVSRKMKASIVFFTGRHGLPVPYRQPIHMAIGETIPVTRKEFPTQEDIEKLHNEVIDAVSKLYESKKPDWETRPLVIL